MGLILLIYTANNNEIKYLMNISASTVYTCLLLAFSCNYS